MGTLTVGTVAAAALVIGPAITGSASGAGSGSLSAPADLAGASATASGGSAGRTAAVGSRAGSADSTLLARHAAQSARKPAARAASRHAARRHGTTVRRASARRASQRHAQPTGTPQQIALAMLGRYGWPASQFSCLDPLWMRESGWNPYATNPYSGAYGIPQALPAAKMASAGPDWQTSAATQIRWGLSYIRATYGSPCGAWAHETAYGWY